MDADTSDLIVIGFFTFFIVLTLCLTYLVMVFIKENALNEYMKMQGEKDQEGDDLDGTI